MTTNALTLERSAPRSVDAVLAVVVAVVAYWFSCVLVPPHDAAIGFGVQWEMVSADPFSFPGQLPQRFLAPLLAWTFGFRGAPEWVLFTRILAGLLLATIFWFCRRRGASVVDATLITVAVALISPVQIYKQNWVGYSDQLTVAVCFWMLLAAPRPVVFWTLYFLALLNHESSVFLLPWAWFVRRAQDARWRGDLLGVTFAVAAYAAFYFYVKSVAPQQAYTNDYFARNPLFPGGAVVVWSLVIAHIVVGFGPLFSVVAWHQHARPRAPERRHLWWLSLGIAVIYCIAFDWSRHVNLLVIPFVFAAIEFLRAGHRVLFVGLAAIGTVLTQIWPQWGIGSWPTTELGQDLAFLMKVGVLVEGERAGDIAFGPLSATLGRWLPEIWPALVSFVTALAAIWAAGAWFARRAPRAAVTADRAA